MNKNFRLDQRLLELNLCASRSQGQAMILAGLIKVNGRLQNKAGAAVSTKDEIEVKKPLHPYVSRGGVKLEGALRDFALNPQGMICMDVGASTGGFSDCLLQHGANHVTAVDVGYGQIAYKLRMDPRIKLYERVNARLPLPEMEQKCFDLIVADVSFISLTLVIPNIVNKLQKNGSLLCLIKPQFEVGREAVKKGGVVRDQQARQEAICKIQNFASDLGLISLGNVDSQLLGPAGTKVFFSLFANAR
jgi:23S rRNA (cytidine1920-2'-O)/16S rRNA (cytidine1409-2'-O)-methyltransferase